MPIVRSPSGPIRHFGTLDDTEQGKSVKAHHLQTEGYSHDGAKAIAEGSVPTDSAVDKLLYLNHGGDDDAAVTARSSVAGKGVKIGVRARLDAASTQTVGPAGGGGRS